MYYKNNIISLITLLRKVPDAEAVMLGDSEHADINGSVMFYQTSRGVVTVAEIAGLPVAIGDCDNPIFGFHIHEGASCMGDSTDIFKDTGAHYNPGNCPHPFHAGDMPPLFSANGAAFLAFISDRFTVSDIIGRTVVIHSDPDDFTTQPSGNSGKKIACGEIVR